MQDDEVFEFVEPCEKSRLGGEVDVGFVEHDHAVETADEPFDVGRREGVARRVVRGAEPQQFGPFVGRGEQGVNRESVLLAERHFAHLDVVDVGGDAVHAVGRGDRDGVVDAGAAEDAVGEVDGLVAAVAERLSFDIAGQVAQLRAERDAIARTLAACPAIERVYPSEANFVLVRTPDPDRLYDALIAAGVIVRNRSRIPGCEGCLRITVGRPDENARMLETVKNFTL